MNFQGQFPGARGGGFAAYSAAAAESRMNEMARIAELNRLQQLSQMNQMQITRLHELTRLTHQAEMNHGIYASHQETMYTLENYGNVMENQFEAQASFDSPEAAGFIDRELSSIDSASDADSHSRGRERDREREGRSRDRGRDRERRRDSDRDSRRSDWSQERSDRSSRNRSRERSNHRDRSPVDSHRGDYDEDEYDRDRRGRSRDGRSDDRHAEANHPSRKIIIRNLHSTVDEKMINDELVRFGLPIKDIRLIRRASGVSRCFAFVEFHNLSDAQRWMELTQGTLLIQNQFRASLAYSIQRDRGGGRDANNMQRFDWVCSKCLGHNFKRRDYCFNCNIPRKESEKGKPSDGQDEVGNNPCNTLIFRGLDALTTEEGLMSALNPVCAPFASIKNVSIIRDEMNTSRGFGFMEFPTVQASTQVLDALTQMAADSPLEVDGKLLLVNYAKNTFNTTMAYIQQAAQAQYDQSYYQQQGQYYDPVSQQYYNYSDYYNQTGNTPTSTSASTSTKATVGEHSTNNAAAVAHAAIQQAQAVKNLQKQVHKKTVGGTEYVNVGGIDYPIYPPPDTSQYQYEETSGYYYDPTTQLYYDASSQYYYNSTTGQFMYWDAEKSTYLPAPNTPENSASPAEAGSEKKEGKDRKDKEKSKMAKKIAKDMEKWAKSMNAQKEAAKDVFKKPVGLPVGLPPLKQESATADAGFAILTKTKDDTLPAPPQLMMADSSQSAQDKKPGLVASYGGDSDSGDEEDTSAPIDESKLVDWTKLACLLCKRQFQSKEILSKHTQVSDLHKKNLESLIQSREAASASKIEYRDRAKERRKKYGAPGPPEPHRRADRGGDGGDMTEPTIMPEQPTKFGIGGDNIGNKLLQKMGWSSGQGLGKDNQGRTAPVEAKRRNQAAGLGLRGSNVVSDVGDDYRVALKKTMFARYSELD